MISNRLTTEQFIERAICKHGWKYNYAKVNYVTTHIYVTLLCLKCGNYFEQTPNSHLSGSGCKQCGILNAANLKRKSVDKFIEDSILVHGSKYDYKKVDYINAHTKVKIWCNNCKKYFWQTPNNHSIQRHGCLTCSISARKESRVSFKKLNLPSYYLYYKRLKNYNDVYKIDKKINEIEVSLLGTSCIYCGKIFVPNLRSVHSRLSVINGKHGGESNFYCSQECKDNCPTFNKILYPKGFKRGTSREVSTYIRKLCFERDNWECQKCNATTNLHCHHIKGYALNKILANDIDNVITFCKFCHKEVHKLPNCNYNELKCKKEK